MIASQDRLEEYKKAIRLKYEVERNEDFSSFLYNPSRGKLRDLCLEIFKENKNLDDLKSFKLFFGFDYSLESLNRLRHQKDKFRPIETFFKGETDLQDIEGINIAAILVNFEARPFAKFRQTNKKSFDTDLIREEEKTIVKEKNSPVERILTPNKREEEGIGNKIEDKKQSGFLFCYGKYKFIALFLLFTALFGGFTFYKFIYKEKDCLRWEVDRYVTIECDSEKNALMNLTRVYNDDRLIYFRKITVNQSTVFFSPDGRPLIWYCKMNRTQIDYFNSNGNGFHPLTGKALKPITQYIIEKYVQKN